MANPTGPNINGPATFAGALLTRLGITPNPQNVKALVGWQQAEGGHWHNTARYNPLNTTLNLPSHVTAQFGVGIKAYDSWDSGLAATLKTLELPAYRGIVAALRKGTAGQVADAIGNSPWGTSSSLIHRTIGSASGAVPSAVSSSAAPSASGTRTIPGTDNSAARRDLIAQFVLQGGPSNDNALIGLASGLQGAQDTPSRKVRVPLASAASVPGGGGGGGPTVGGFKAGSPVPGVAPHAATHQTDGLPGYPAFDYMAPAGSPALAPVSGTVFKLSGHDPAAGPTNGPHGPFGWSVYIRGTDGRSYFLTHMGSRNVRVGQHVQAGGQIGTVGNYAKWGGANHIHMGVHG